LWFDETYDERNFRFQSSLEAAARASLVAIVGTTGATTLPHHIGNLAASRGIPMLVINPEPNPFSELVERYGNGIFLEGTTGEWIPRIARALACP
jgi:NAD-dependent deacetylase